MTDPSPQPALGQRLAFAEAARTCAFTVRSLAALATRAVA